ncbi:Hypothetical_protein [Hexamita inflata]|uniref:Hypothetical_protein n=1 Tax=Hexamita inflata TaxID=28002 RepID=A0AA86PGB7_9EUKA|nr:Hypothetical protein HINF_LOCUS24413 [Hexamita inflata]
MPTRFKLPQILSSSTSSIDSVDTYTNLMQQRTSKRVNSIQRFPNLQSCKSTDQLKMLSMKSSLEANTQKLQDLQAKVNHIQKCQIVAESNINQLQVNTQKLNQHIRCIIQFFAQHKLHW